MQSELARLNTLGKDDNGNPYELLSVTGHEIRLIKITLNVRVFIKTNIKKNSTKKKTFGRNNF